MKCLFLSTVTLFSGLFSYSQWTPPDASGNIYNTNTGKVGIGTSVP